MEDTKVMEDWQAKLQKLAVEGRMSPGRNLGISNKVAS